MPAIKSIEVGDNKVIIITNDGNVNSLNVTVMPAATVQQAESWLNNNWLPSISKGDFQLVAKVLSMNPLRCIITAADNSVILPPGWAGIPIPLTNANGQPTIS